MAEISTEYSLQDTGLGAPDAGLSMCVSERRLLLTALDLLAVNGALALALALRPGAPFGPGTLLRHAPWFLLLSLLWLPLARAFEAYDLRVAARFASAAWAALKAALVVAALTLPLFLLAPGHPAVPWAAVLVGVALLLAGRGFYSLALAQPVFRRRVLIVGAGWAGRAIAQALSARANGSYEIVGFVDDDPEKLGRAAWEQEGGGAEAHSPLLPGTSAPPLVLGDRHALPALIAGHGVTTLVLAITHEVDGRLPRALLDCLEQGVEIVPMPVLYEELTGRVPVEYVGDHWYAAMPLEHPGTTASWPLLKRLFDLLSAGLGALCLTVALPFIALAIYLDSPGPIFYTQERVGKGGRRFRVYKFRSMVPDAEKQGRAVWAEEDDPRVTRVGRLLRKTHLDEFPQFFNILKGEMSAVGPRPERPEFVAELAREIPFYRVRHAVKPGMAGWGLVKQGYGSSKEDALLKLQYDLYYIKHQSLWLDVVILLRTVLDTLTLGGR